MAATSQQSFVLDLAEDHGLRVRNVVTSMQNAETRVVFKESDA